MEEEFEKIFNAVIEGADENVANLVAQTLNGGAKAGDILNKGLIRAMDEVGNRFESGEYFIPDMLIAAKAMKAGMALLKPLLVNAGVASVGRVVIGTIKGDLHDIGKNLVSMMLEGGGFEVIDLGTDVSPEKFASAVREHNPDIVGMSALLTTTMIHMKDAIEAIDDIGLKKQVKILIGGAPVTQEYAEKIGADGYASDAIKAVMLAKSLMD
ncbi:MAG TPA: corrinoid protein, partial [Anaerolineales bacterium]|nr:corrinoid protein [Anaerolineales bacterium]